MNEFSKIEECLMNVYKKNNNKTLRVIKDMALENYKQLESLSWLQRQLKLKFPLPPLRGWPVSPDFLLRLHTWVCKNKPRVCTKSRPVGIDVCKLHIPSHKSCGPASLGESRYGDTP